MKKIGEFIMSPQIGQMKQDSLLSLSKEKHIQSFIKENHIDSSMMNEYWVEFLDFNDDYKTCMHCTSLESCPKDNQGMKKNLIYRDHEISIEIESCQFSKTWEEKRDLLERFVVTNVKEEMLLTDLASLDILRKQDLTPNEKKALAYVYKYAKEHGNTGLFLHGDMGSGKTTLLAGLMNALAKSGKNVGFIHFPTYLIDLKSSFSTGETEYALDKIMKTDYLLLDGIGEENVTAWSRDEILLSILSYRLLNQLPTFFTSMYGYKDLTKVYTIKKGDEIRVNTLISKMMQLTQEIMLDGGKIK